MQFTITHEGGRFKFDEVPHGNYVVLAFAFGYLPDFREIGVAPGDEVRVVFFLTPDGIIPEKASMFGSVTEHTLFPTFAPVYVPGALIQLIPNLPIMSPLPIDPAYETVTNNRGEYRIDGIVVGLPVHMSGEEGGKAKERRRAPSRSPRESPA